MLFNSQVFLLAFLPVFLLAVAGAQRWSPRLILPACIFFSLIFYGFWDYRYLALILGSVVVNYQIGRTLAARPSRPLLWIGIIGNLAAIGWFKYYNFFVLNLYLVGVTEFPFLEIILPLGISFFTFQQISYLVDTYKGDHAPRSFEDYLFFVTFFPQLIAGPIVRWSEVAPQIEANRPRMSAAEMAPGITLLIIGLAKKVLLADPVSEYSTPVFSAVASGGAVDMATAWQGALAYTMQIYFDFSGYSDMALGLALMVGIHLPLNFDSPYKSVSIIEFWRRWHMTLSRFLRDYLYIPLGGGRKGAVRQRTNLLVVMLLGGLWHGAGFTFLIWGLLHGLYLLVNHAFRAAVGARLPASGPAAIVVRALSWGLTFLCVVCAWVFFRAPDHGTAFRMLSAMAGLGMTPADSAATTVQTLTAGPDTALAFALIGGLLVIALVMPNSQTIVGIAGEAPRARPPAPTAEVETAPLAGGTRGYGAEPAAVTAPAEAPAADLRWRPSARWAAAAGLLLAAVLASLSNPSEFLYFQF